MKISIIGLGHVGSTLAYTLVLKGLASELLLINRSADRARGDALDLTHALSFGESRAEIRAATLQESAGSDIVVLTLSVPFAPPMKDRADLAKGNRGLFRSMLPEIARLSPQARLIVITNPVDAMTWWALEDSGFPASRVMGVGTLIDSARFRIELSRRFAVHHDDVRAYVLGEHGPSQFAAMSVANSGGESMGDAALAKELLLRQEGQAREIMSAKGYTNFAIASAASLVIESIVNDQRKTIPVSVKLEDYFGVSGVCLSVPCVIGRQGVERVLKPALTESEKESFRLCAQAVEAQMRRAVEE